MNYFFILAGTLFVCLAFSWILPFLLLDRRLKKHFKTMPEIQTLSSALMRIPSNAFCVVFPNRISKNALASQLYKDFNFREFSSPFEIFLSYLFTISFFLIIFLDFTGLVLDFFGYIQLESR